MGGVREFNVRAGSGRASRVRREVQRYRMNRKGPRRVGSGGGCVLGSLGWR